MTTPAPTLFDPAVANDPYPFYAYLRREAPVAPLGAMGLWGTSRYEDVIRILRDPETSRRWSAERAAGEARRAIFDDPPIHTRMRGLLTRAFTPRVIELQREAIEENCRRMVDQMLAGDCDRIAGLAYRCL